MSHDEVIAAARAFVMETFLYTHPHAVVHPDEPLLGAGIIDSMGVIEMVEWISSAWGIYVEDDEITEENLGTLSAIARYVSHKRASRAAA